MKLNFNKKFLDAKGQETNEVIADVLQQVLYTVGANEKFVSSPDEKYSAYKIMQKLSTGAEVEVTVDEAGFLKRVCGSVLMAGAYGQVVDLIEGINY
jgi:hypothetical protein